MLSLSKVTSLSNDLLRPRLFVRGECLMLRSDLLWKIEWGYVRTLTWDTTGDIMTLGVWGAGDVVWKPSCESEGANRRSPEREGANRRSPEREGANRRSPEREGANRRSPVLYKVECLTQVQASNSSLSAQSLETLLYHLERLQEFLEIIQCQPTTRRLLKFLNWLAQRFGDEHERGRVIDLPFTQQLLAEITGMARATVTRLMSQFEREGRLIRLRDRRILLPDVTAQA